MALVAVWFSTLTRSRISSFSRGFRSETIERIVDRTRLGWETRVDVVQRSSSVRSIVRDADVEDTALVIFADVGRLRRASSRNRKHYREQGQQGRNHRVWAPDALQSVC